MMEHGSLTDPDEIQANNTLIHFSPETLRLQVRRNHFRTIWDRMNEEEAISFLKKGSLDIYQKNYHHSVNSKPFDL